MIIDYSALFINIMKNPVLIIITFFKRVSMLVQGLNNIIAEGNNYLNIFNYELAENNPIWRYILVLLTIIVTLIISRIVQFAISSYTLKKEKQKGVTILTLFLKCLIKPISVMFFALGIYAAKLCMVFADPEAVPPVRGISTTVETTWTQISQAIAAIAIAYALYKLVDLVEHYLYKWTSRTQTKLDDMLVPVVRKALRVTIAIVAAIHIVDNVLHQDVKSILLGAGLGGVAIALAAKDTLANFFGSITIFADRPFQVDELVEIEGNRGFVEEVGFRSTKIRTLEGHFVSVPNSIITNSVVINIGKRPYIRRTSNITITYDSGHKKAKKAVEIIKEILEQVPEVKTDPETPPRIYFSDFNDSSLNIYMSYWVNPPDYWLFHEVNQRVNLEMMKRFEAEGIEFAFPTQTLYVKKDQ